MFLCLCVRCSFYLIRTKCWSQFPLRFCFEGVQDRRIVGQGNFCLVRRWSIFQTGNCKSWFRRKMVTDLRRLFEPNMMIVLKFWGKNWYMYDEIQIYQRVCLAGCWFHLGYFQIFTGKILDMSGYCDPCISLSISGASIFLY